MGFSQERIKGKNTINASDIALRYIAISKLVKQT